MSTAKRGLILLSLVVILVAGVARMTLALHNHRALYDEVLVMEMADQIVKGQGYTLEFAWWPALAPDGWPQPDAQNRPLLPTLIAGAWLVFGKSVPMAAAVVAVAASLCVLVAFLMGWRVAGHWALVAVVVMLVNAQYLHVSITGLTSPVYGLFLALAVWTFCSAWGASGRSGIGWWALVGVFCGLGWLTRPEGPLILPSLMLAVGVLWWQRRRVTPRQDGARRSNGGGTPAGVRRLGAGFLLAGVLFVVVSSPLLIYNLTNFGTVFHATTIVTQWAPSYEARFSVTPPTAGAYWATHTPGDYVGSVADNLVWMLALLGEYLTWPVLALLLVAAGLAIWRASSLTAVVTYTVVFLLTSLLQSPMSIWPGSQYFMYYSSILPLWAVLIAWGLRELWPALWATRFRRLAALTVLVVEVVLIVAMDGTQMVNVVRQVSHSQTAVADPRLHDFRWMAEHVAPDAIVMTWDTENLHWYSDHRRAVMVPADDTRTIQSFMRRFAVTHFYYNDWLATKRPALKPLRQALHAREDLGPYSILRPVHVGDGILFEVDWAGPSAVLLVAPTAETEESVAQTWLRYTVAAAMPADLTAYPAVIASGDAAGLAGRYQPVDARFGESIELLGYQIESQPLNPEPQTLQITLYWRCVAPTEVDYTVFNHLLDVEGAWVAQQDGPPANGLYPTSWWQPGEVVVDQHTIAIPIGTPPGHYQLSVGLYEFATMQRLPVHDGGRDAVILAPIAIGGPQ